MNEVLLEKVQVDHHSDGEVADDTDEQWLNRLYTNRHKRRSSLEPSPNLQLRKLITQYVMVRIDEMEFNSELARQILEQMESDQFQDNRQEAILERVVQSIMLVEQYNREGDFRTQRNISIQLQGLLGNKYSNFVSYFSNNSRRSSQVHPGMQQICGICLSALSQPFYSRLSCEHVFCRDCYVDYCSYKITNGEVNTITCPFEGCSEYVSDELIMELLGVEMFQKLIKFRKIKEVSQSPDQFWCPRPGCEEILQKPGAALTKQKLACRCGQQICGSCLRPYHPHQSCRRVMDNQFRAAEKKLKIQRCPKCNAPIQKNDGCNHMVCKQCSYQFCWLCRSKYSSSRHYASYNVFGCPGMQFSHRDPWRYPKIYRCFFILALLALGPPAVIIGAIIGFFFLVLGLPAIIYMSYVSTYKFRSYGCCRQTITILLLVFGCIVSSPLSLAIVLLGLCGLILVGIPYSIYSLIEWLRD